MPVAGRRTLLVDLDQRADLTARFGFTPDTLDYSMVDVLAPRNSVPIANAIVRGVQGVVGLDLLASDIRASGLEEQLTGVSFREAIPQNTVARMAQPELRPRGEARHRAPRKTWKRSIRSSQR